MSNRRYIITNTIKKTMAMLQTQADTRANNCTFTVHMVL